MRCLFPRRSAGASVLKRRRLPFGFVSVAQETPPMESDLPFDFNSIKEEEFDKFVDYIVLDQPPDPNNPNRAESSLPRNLKLKKIGKKVRGRNALA